MFVDKQETMRYNGANLETDGCRMGNPQGKLKTRVFDIAEERGISASELARKMGLHRSVISRVKAGGREINRAFIAGAQRAFPHLSLGEMFYVEQAPAEEKAS